ncbi:ATP-binding protein [Roseivivax sediminis]|uniref:AAA domain-containing protein n=1 Tax=Roseivivax sediminis TaxID=936889 RepID=A0A1I2ESK1_9RHOB|nr:ATP-binding protein [Roseivivax sediminis]SFE95456.1 AAA domain-containing protein [Roseivivax sediminis]
MAEQYDFGNLSPIEFEALVADLMSAELGVRFETFSEGADGGIDARHSSATGNVILQAKHYRNSTWADLETSAKRESPKVHRLNPNTYYFLTSQKLTPDRKFALQCHLGHPSVTVSNILGRTELNALIRKHSEVEKSNIKLWLSSAAVLQRLLTNDIAVFTEATKEGMERVLKVFVANPSLPKAAKILKKQHCLIVSGPPGVGKTTLSQVLAAEYSEEGWELVAISSIEKGYEAFHPEKKQVFVFDDFLGKIKLDARSLAKDDAKIAGFMRLVSGRTTKRFILTTRKYILETARTVSEALDDDQVELTEMILDLDVYTREIKARILYNHLYHSGLEESAIAALLGGDTVSRIVDHPHYMPRIVHWMTDHVRFRDSDPEEYPRAFIQALDNPEKVWEKPFQHHISGAARVMLYCMFLSRRETFFGSGGIEKGIKVEELRDLFESSLSAFSIERDGTVPESRFEETLREIKSSFIVLQGGTVNFINPSVQDFLSRRVNNPNILDRLARSVTTFNNAADLWKVASEYFNGKPMKSTQIASVILLQIKSGAVAGRLPLEDLAPLLGDLIFKSERFEFTSFLRGGGLSTTAWINEVELPSLIDDLMFGKYSELQHAQAFGRWLRLQLFKYLSKRDYVLEIEELGLLADNLPMYREDLPECILEKFEEAATESIDSLESSGITGHEDRETAIGTWLEQIEKIEGYLGRPVDSWKRSELEGEKWSIQQLHEQQMQEFKDSGGLRRSSSSSGESLNSPPPASPSVAARSGFSNVDLRNMFSSLRK